MNLVRSLPFLLGVFASVTARAEETGTHRGWFAAGRGGIGGMVDQGALSYGAAWLGLGVGPAAIGPLIEYARFLDFSDGTLQGGRVGVEARRVARPGRTGPWLGLGGGYGVMVERIDASHVAIPAPLPGQPPAPPPGDQVTTTNGAYLSLGLGYEIALTDGLSLGPTLEGMLFSAADDPGMDRISVGIGGTAGPLGADTDETAHDDPTIPPTLGASTRAYYASEFGFAFGVEGLGYPLPFLGVGVQAVRHYIDHGADGDTYCTYCVLSASELGALVEVRPVLPVAPYARVTGLWGRLTGNGARRSDSTGEHFEGSFGGADLEGGVDARLVGAALRVFGLAKIYPSVETESAVHPGAGLSLGVVL